MFMPYKSEMPKISEAINRTGTPVAVEHQDRSDPPNDGNDAMINVALYLIVASRRVPPALCSHRLAFFVLISARGSYCLQNFAAPIGNGWWWQPVFSGHTCATFGCVRWYVDGVAYPLFLLSLLRVLRTPGSQIPFHATDQSRNQQPNPT